nr:MAG TPA: hypothetical protein [Ackermannviridae sp.]
MIYYAHRLKKLANISKAYWCTSSMSLFYCYCFTAI